MPCPPRDRHVEDVSERVGGAIDRLAEDPRPVGSKKLADVDAYRIRAGDYRIIYAIKDASLIVLVVKVADRRDVYKDIDAIRKRLKK
jgi:mRNA interferase RelE/StbE